MACHAQRLRVSLSRRGAHFCKIFVTAFHEARDQIFQIAVDDDDDGLTAHHNALCRQLRKYNQRGRYVASFADSLIVVTVVRGRGPEVPGIEVMP